MPRRYPPEFRRKVLDLLKSGRTVADVASALDVTEQTIYNWRNQELIDVGFAMIAAAVQTTALPIDNVTIHGPIAVAVGAAVLGSLFGIASQLAAFAIRTATGGRDAHVSGDQMLLREG
ncbi:transposase (plasmid) [Rhodococcus globerulus]|uniref:transposase n=1 Tax=Rhodococcus globerulus TaxID=33008 RepID=UPI0039EB9116